MTMMDTQDAAKPLKEFKPKYGFFVGIDSDGCAFDTMEIKHKECFIPNIIKYFDLQAVSKYARQAAEFVNLYSKWRGINRWPALIKVFDLLAQRKEVAQRKAKVPEVGRLREWIAGETKLGNPALVREIERTPDAVLSHALEWSLSVNVDIAEMVKGVGPFPYMRESLEKVMPQADIIVVSQTPTEALVREWDEHKINEFTELIAGQEMGTKAEHIQFAASGKYEPDHMLMIGDAPGDLEAARHNDALFYPINPGSEEQSWKDFYEEGFDRFIKGQYAGSYQDGLIAEFEKILPEVPPWDTNHR